MGLYRVRVGDEETFNAHTTGVLCEHGRLYFTLTPGETYIPVDALVHLERLDTPPPVHAASSPQPCPPDRTSFWGLSRSS